MEVCKFCFDDDGELLSICECKGSMKWVHKDCAEKWIRIKNDLTCPVCFTIQRARFSKKKFWNVLTIDDINIMLQSIILMFMIIYTGVLLFDSFYFFFKKELPKSFFLSFLSELVFLQVFKMVYSVYLYMLERATIKRMIQELILTISLHLVNTTSIQSRLLFGYLSFGFIVAFSFLFLWTPYVNNLIEKDEIKLSFSPYEIKMKHQTQNEQDTTIS